MTRGKSQSGISRKNLKEQNSKFWLQKNPDYYLNNNQTSNKSYKFEYKSQTKQEKNNKQLIVARQERFDKSCYSSY